MSRLVVYILIVLTPKNDLASLPDLALLELLCASADDDLIYDHFVSRFLPDLKAECRRICAKRKLDNHLGNQIAHECFERIRAAKTFSVKKANVTNPRKAILVYLFQCANNRFIDYYKRDKKAILERRSYLDDIQDEIAESLDPEDLDRKQKLTDIILLKLSPNERKVIIADAEYKRGQSYLPDEVLEDLAFEMKVKPDTIRKIRERGLQKIKKAIDEINQKR